MHKRWRRLASSLALVATSHFAYGEEDGDNQYPAEHGTYPLTSGGQKQTGWLL